MGVGCCFLLGASHIFVLLGISVEYNNYIVKWFFFKKKWIIIRDGKFKNCQLRETCLNDRRSSHDCLEQ